MMRTVALLAATLALAACVPGLKAPPAPVAHTLALPAAPAGPGPTAVPAPLVAVPDTAAGAAYATPAMVYRRGDDVVHVFAHHRWADRPARLVNEALRAALEQAGAVALIPGAGTRPDWRLLSELLVLEQDFSARPSVVRLHVRVQLVALPERAVAAARTFQLEQPAATDDPAGGAAAANALLAQLGAQVRALWLAALASAPPAGRPVPAPHHPRR